ncbi:putative odorant receptor 83c [Uranotaenia lowii]|uniref:putative odorant receptor 83c n=1 Tax=Uranotaenia lowii TaxID=190385 RepID=UPI0024786788|nr:putative odorant receptor 83c [Uranotaenia lowii]
MEVLNKFRQLLWLFDERTYDNRRGIDVFNGMIAEVREFCVNVGADIIDPKYRPNWRTVILFTSVVTFFISICYTFYHKWGHWLYLVEAAPIVALFVQAVVKTYHAFFSIPFLRSIYGLIAVDVICMIIILQIFGVADVFINQLKSLDDVLEQENRNEEIVNKKIIDICLMHEEIIQYEVEMDESYKTVVLVQIITSIAEISTTLFVFYLTGHINALFLAVSAVWQLLEFCLLGVTLTIKNEQIVRSLYDIKWYRLTTKQQKILGIVLQGAQNAVEITIGGLALLNLETFVEVMKKIYSYYAMLMQFLEQ